MTNGYNYTIYPLQYFVYWEYVHRVIDFMYDTDKYKSDKQAFLSDGQGSEGE